MVRVAIIGTSRAARLHATAFSECHDVRLVGVSARSIDSARNFAQVWKIPIATSEISELLHLSKPDIVIVATPPHVRFEILMELLRHDIGLVSEKPLTLDVRHAEMIVDSAVRAGAFNALALEYRFSPSRRQLSELLSQRKIGELKLVEATEYSNLLDGHDRTLGQWVYDHQLGGSLRASHTIDLLLQTVGKIRQVNAAATRFTGSSAHASTIVLARFVSGTLGSFCYSPILRIVDREVRYHGTKGSLILSNERYLRQRGINGDETTTDYGDASSMEACFASLARRTIEAFSGSSTEIPTFQDGLALAKVHHAIVASADLSQTVTIRNG